MPNQLELASALYYTFSTISQTLAGAIGLLAAFAVLRLSILDNLLRDEATIIKSGGIGPNAEVRQQAITLFSTGQIKEFLRLCRENFESLGVGVKDYRLPWAEKLQSDREVAVRSLWTALLATGAAIVVSVVMLSMAPWLSQNPCTAMICLAVGVILVGVCVWLYYGAIKNLLGRL